MQEGKEPLYCCKLCSIHMSAGRITNQHRKKNYGRNMQMRFLRRDRAIASQCTESSLSLTGEDEAECIEGVETLNYMGRLLDWFNNNWLVVR